MYHQIIITPTNADTKEWKQERNEVSLKLVESIKKREKYLYQPIVPNHENPILSSFQEQVHQLLFARRILQHL